MFDKDEIIEMARQAGFGLRYEGRGQISSAPTTTEKLEAFAKLVAAKEREACARLSQTLPNSFKNCQISAHASDMAIIQYSRAIRARGEA